MKKEIIIDGFRYTLRSDGVYETQELALYPSTLDWISPDVHVCMLGILIPHGNQYLAKYVKTENGSTKSYFRLLEEVRKEFPDACACEATKVMQNTIDSVYFIGEV